VQSLCDAAEWRGRVDCRRYRLRQLRPYARRSIGTAGACRLAAGIPPRGCREGCERRPVGMTSRADGWLNWLAAQRMALASRVPGLDYGDNDRRDRQAQAQASPLGLADRALTACRVGEPARRATPVRARKRPRGSARSSPCDRARGCAARAPSARRGRGASARASHPWAAHKITAAGRAVIPVPAIAKAGKKGSVHGETVEPNTHRAVSPWT
jgi:hypothetical protein